MIECPRCGVKLPDEGITSVEPAECSTCGFQITSGKKSPPGSETGLDIIRNYFSDLWHIITRPTAFFSLMPLHGGINRPLCFALVTHWLGAALGFLWHTFMGGSLLNQLQLFLQKTPGLDSIDNPGRNAQISFFRDRILNWFTGVGPVIADPFLTLISVLFASFFLFVGARILVTPGKSGHPKEISFESAVRITCYGMSPAILAGIPILGALIAPLMSWFITVIGVRQAYRISNGRAIMIALFPKLVVPGIIGMGLLLFLFAVFKFFMSSF